MTKPAKAVSYADAAKWAATTASVLANQYPWKRDAQKYLHQAAALRALAALVEGAKAVEEDASLALREAIDNNWRLKATIPVRDSDHDIRLGRALRLLSALAAGYTPPEDGQR